MIESIFNTLMELLYKNIWIASFSSFIWGIFSILLSPCHLSSIPLIVGFLSTQENIDVKKTFKLSFVFAIGILVSISIIGGITLAMGRIMGDIGSIGTYFVALILFIVGLYLLDIIRLPWNGIKIGRTKYKSFLAVLTLGFIFGVGLGPCTFAFMAPILGVVFEVSSSDLKLAISLLFAFALGHIFIIVLAGTLIKEVQQYLNWTEKSKAALYFKKVCGGLVILGGIYLFYKNF